MTGGPPPPGLPVVRDDPRMAGQVVRYHTWPAARRESNAEHCWQVARILLNIYPDAQRVVVTTALFHDVGEIVTGDAPFPVKRDNPVLKREHDRIEEAAALAMALPWGVPRSGPLDLHERWAIKVADYLDMWEWGLQEQAMGNKFARIVSERTLGEVERMCREREEEPEFSDIVVRARAYVQKRRSAWSAVI